MLTREEAKQGTREEAEKFTKEDVEQPDEEVAERVVKKKLESNQRRSGEVS